MVRFKVDFHQRAYLEINDERDVNEENSYQVEFIDTDTNKIAYSVDIVSNRSCWVDRWWFTNWEIRVRKSWPVGGKKSEVIYTHKYNSKDKWVKIHIASSNIGDSLAWFPYVEEFKKKHKCKMIVNVSNYQLFEENYASDDFIFDKGQDLPEQYARYHVGIFGYRNEGPHYYEFKPHANPRDQSVTSMSEIATDILGLPSTEVKPRLVFPDKQRSIDGKYVCIAIGATAQAKYWNRPNGWQEVVNYLKNAGYKVVLISKEPEGFMGNEFWENKFPSGIIDKSGDIPLEDRMNDLKYADFFIGTSSGLSWLAWAVDIPVILITGHNHSWYNFKDKTSVVSLENNDDVCTGCWHKQGFAPGDWWHCPKYKDTDNHFECTTLITSDMVIDKIKSRIKQIYKFDIPSKYFVSDLSAYATGIGATSRPIWLDEGFVGWEHNSVADLWDRVYRDNYLNWQSPESKSGYGTVMNAGFRIECINKIIEKYNIESILDIGCGDLFWMSKIDNLHKIKRYVGVDISTECIRENEEKYKDINNVEFFISNFSNKNENKFFESNNGKSWDLVLMFDILNHCIQAEIDEMVDFILRSNIKYFLINNHPLEIMKYEDELHVNANEMGIWWPGHWDGKSKYSRNMPVHLELHPRFNFKPIETFKGGTSNR